MTVMLLLFTFYLNGGLHAVSIGKPSERMSKFWTVRFSNTEPEKNFGFSHIPIHGLVVLAGVWLRTSLMETNAEVKFGKQ